MKESLEDSGRPQWFVMRDLKRSNAKLPAYRQLTDLGVEVFTPMTWRIVTRHGKPCRERVPFMRDLLFVRATRVGLDPLVERVDTLQYRYVRGGYKVPMTVRESDMDRFIRAVKFCESPCYYTPEEVTPDMIGRGVRIVGGPLDGYEGHLRKTRGSRVKRLLVELPGFLVAAVEVRPEYVRLL